MKRTDKAKWTKEEINLLDSLIKYVSHECRSKSIKNKWNEIAKELFIVSNKRFFRSAKQCREHWINHLNPDTLRIPWGIDEDIQLIEYIERLGKKWALISKMFNGRRTEHMVKNRFKSLMNN